jgi:hypothetical protein
MQGGTCLSIGVTTCVETGALPVNYRCPVAYLRGPVMQDPVYELRRIHLLRLYEKGVSGGSSLL